MASNRSWVRKQMMWLWVGRTPCAKLRSRRSDRRDKRGRLSDTRVYAMFKHRRIALMTSRLLTSRVAVVSRSYRDAPTQGMYQMNSRVPSGRQSSTVGKATKTSQKPLGNAELTAPHSRRPGPFMSSSYSRVATRTMPRRRHWP